MLDKIYLEITNVCNLSCPFCPPGRGQGRFMAREEFELYLDRLEGRGRRLYFHVKGESLLHPDLGSFIERARERGYAVWLTTNGTLLAERSELLLAARGLRKLSVSLHSRAGSAAVGEYWRGIGAFLDLHRAAARQGERPAPPFPVSLRLWNRGAGRLPAENEALWELLRERYPGAGDWDEARSNGTSLRLDEGVYLNQAEEFAWPDLALPLSGTKGSCLGLRDQVGILADGTVVPCCLDAEGVMALGSLRESGLGEILARPRARAIREGFERGELVEELCRTCGYRRRFDAPRGAVD